MWVFRRSFASVDGGGGVVDDNELARALNVNRVQESAVEDARWVARFYRTLREEGVDSEDHALALTQQWLDAQIGDGDHVLVVERVDDDE